MKNFLIGISAGIGNIIPGVSGSALLIMFNVYDKAIEAISNIFKNFKKNFLFLLSLGLGIVIGTYGFSKVVSYFITNYEVITRIVFLFLILGTIPSIFNRIDKKSYKKSNLMPFIITFILGVLLLISKTSHTNIAIETLNIKTIFILMGSGLILACSTIIPGISSTLLLNMIGVYKTYLSAISSFKINILIPIMLGFTIGIFLLSKLINHLLKNYYNYALFAILGFVISTIPSILPKTAYTPKELLIALPLGIIAFILTYSIEKGHRP